MTKSCEQQKGKKEQMKTRHLHYKNNFQFSSRLAIKLKHNS